MAETQILLLVGAGLATGFVAGLIGLGGGIIFAPVLFFYFQAIGIDPALVTPLTLGTSLLCTMLAGLSSAWFQWRRDSVQPRVAVAVGLLSAAAVFVVTRYVTTEPWYDAAVFQIVFSVVLLVVVVRMVTGSGAARARNGGGEAPPRVSWSLLGGIGSAAGAVSSAVGVGGGVVLVPAYHNLLRLPVRMATGTSSATIVIIAGAGVLMYALSGGAAAVPSTALGYVDVGHALLLAGPSLLSARFGVQAAHRVDGRLLRWSFAAAAAFVAVRMAADTLGWW